MSLDTIINIFINRPVLATVTLVLIVATLINLVVERIWGDKGKISFIITIISLILVEAALIILPLDNIGDKTREFFIYDEFSRFFAIFAIFVTIMIAVAIYYYSEGLPQIPAFYALITGTALGLILLPSAVDLVAIFVAWELLSVPLYAMVAYSHKWSRSLEGAIKYYTMGAASSAILGLGIGIMGALTGTTNLYALTSRLNVIMSGSDSLSQMLLGFGVVVLVVGFGVKLTLVPLHQWAPDTYEGSMPPITAYLSGTIKAVRLAAPLKVFMFLVATLRYDARLYLAILSFLTMTYANIVALKQARVYRMMAYSSIAQMGYIIIGLVAATDYGLTAAIFYALAFAIMEVTVFIVIGIVIFYMNLESIDDYNGLASKYPGLATMFALSLLSLVGIPPLVGFAGKVYLFIAAWSANLQWLAIALAINSGISIGYYGLIVKRMFLDEPSEKIKEVKIPRPYIVIIGILTAIILVLGIYPAILEKYASQAASTL